MLLTHGVRSVLRGQGGRPVVCVAGHWTRKQEQSQQGGFALANKLARICHATLSDKELFGEEHQLSKKINGRVG